MGMPSSTTPKFQPKADILIKNMQQFCLIFINNTKKYPLYSISTLDTIFDEIIPF